MRLTIALAAAGMLAAAAAPATARGTRSTSPGCHSSACSKRVCTSLACRYRAATKLRPRRLPTAPAIASWYGPGLYGNRLACGGVLTPGTFGVAHKSLPCGTRVRICAARCATAPVVDRGPFVPGRDFDLTAPVRAAIGAAPVASVRWAVVG